MVKTVNIFEILNAGQSRSYANLRCQSNKRITIIREVFFSLVARITEQRDVSAELLLAQGYEEIFNNLNQLTEFFTKLISHGSALGEIDVFYNHDFNKVAKILDKVDDSSKDKKVSNE